MRVVCVMMPVMMRMGPQMGEPAPRFAQEPRMRPVMMTGMLMGAKGDPLDAVMAGEEEPVARAV